MTYTMNDQLAAQLAQLQPRLAQFPDYTPGDALSWRARSNALYALINDVLPVAPGVAKEEFHLPFSDQTLRARWYQPQSIASKGAVLFVHGGGGVAGSVDLYDKIVANYAQQSGVPFLSLEYGLAPETAGHTQAEQAVAALLWLQQHSARFDVDPARIVLMGDSGGGGIAASAALLARDRAITAAGLVLIYPMLDNRPGDQNAALAPFLTVTPAELATVWRARTPADVSDALMPYVSPAHAQSLAGLPPVYIDVGELDLFCLESLKWAEKLAAGGVPAEFHLYPGVNHGFELLAPQADIARQAMRLRCEALRRMTA